MLKKSQITVVVISSIIILILLFVLFVGIRNVSKQSMDKEISKGKEVPFDINIVKKFTDDCLDMVSENAVWMIGAKGGYIDVEGSGYYDEPSAQGFVEYNYNKIPIYVHSNDINIPSLEDIENKLSKYILVEFDRCLNFSSFEERGVQIKKPDVDYTVKFVENKDVTSNVNINMDTVVVEVNFPLEIRKNDQTTKLTEFISVVGLGLGRLHSSTIVLAEKLADAAPNQYDIRPDCDELYDKNDMTHVYFKKNEVVIFNDFESFYGKYQKTYIYQFAIAGDARLRGVCSG